MTSSSANDLASVAADVGESDDLAVIDLDHLSTFTDDDADLEAELADLFSTTARRYLTAMQTAVLEERAWSAEVHALKGASANLGARRVAALAKAAEFATPSEAWLQVLRLALEDVTAFFAERRVKRQP